MNRQVPETIAIVGNGKVARHMLQYFAAIGQPHTHWFRPTTNASTASQPRRSRLARYRSRLKQLFKPAAAQAFETAIATASTVLLLLPDDQIESFVANNPSLQGKQLVHFSGSLVLDGVVGCHPLMTFGPELYPAARYAEIPFVIDEGVDFKRLFPLFENPVHTIKTEHKAMYHALCVMAGNFSQMLWQGVGTEMQAMGLPRELMHQYLQQNTQNFVTDPDKAATGPFIRGDNLTIAKHQKALKDHPLGDIYQAFFNWYHQPEQTIDHAHKRQSS